MKILQWLQTLTIVAAAGTSSIAAADLAELAGSDDPQVRELAGGFVFTEGPAWSPKGFLLFSDVRASRIIRYDADGSVSDFLNPSGNANGLVFDAAGNLYACQGGARRVVKIGAQDGKIEVLAERYDGKPLNSPNDLALDASGGLYFTDPRYGQDADVDQPVMGVYYISADGKLTRVIDDLERPNGILVSSDGKTLFVAEPNKAQLYRYEISAPGQIAGKKLIFTGDRERDGGGPDGMALDAQGNVYATYAGVVVLTPDGDVIGRIEVPQRPANCIFGGGENQTLYITARTALYGTEMKVAGAALKKSGPRPPAQVSSRRRLPVRTIAETKETEKQEVKTGDLTLTVPQSWKQEKPSNRLRLAQFVIPAADKDEENAELVISFFGGDGGGVTANVRRWVGQFQSEERKAVVTTGESPQGRYVFADISGTYNKPIGPPIAGQTKPTPDSRMLAVILTVPDKGNYFLKLVGPAETIEAALDDFRKSFGGDAAKEKPLDDAA